MISENHTEPFGCVSCEEELSVLGEERYSKLFLDETPFNSTAVANGTYLIIGRRGSGKTALVEYFSFQEQIPGSLCIEVRRPETFQEVLGELTQHRLMGRAIAVPYLKRLWELVIWKLIGRALHYDTAEIVHTHGGDVRSNRASQLIADWAQNLLGFYGENDAGSIGSTFDQLADAEDLDKIKDDATRYAKNRPIVIAIETLEQYDIRNDAVMYALAALIEYASRFNREYARKNIHLKVFVAGEVYQLVKEEVLLNPLKAIRHPVYLQWRPRDLLRFIGWRLYRHLNDTGLWNINVGGIDWDDYDEVLEKVWVPHFGRSLTNARGQVEDTWPYILRHTQMRPRQLIVLCNAIANRAVADGTFPKFSETHIINGIKDAENDLASEILNSFSEVYPHVTQIIRTLHKIPKVFTGNELDARAARSRGSWPPGDYEPWRFSQLVAELGIIGLATRGGMDDKFIDADFEYGSPDRLHFAQDDLCVVHPMFYRRLDVTMNTTARVMPFTTSRP